MGMSRKMKKGDERWAVGFTLRAVIWNDQLCMERIKHSGKPIDISKYPHICLDGKYLRCE